MLDGPSIADLLLSAGKNPWHVLSRDGIARGRIVLRSVTQSFDRAWPAQFLGVSGAGHVEPHQNRAISRDSSTRVNLSSRANDADAENENEEGLDFDYAAYNALTNAEKQAKYDASRARGKRLLCYLEDPESAEPSTFMDVSDLEAWGWEAFDSPMNTTGFHQYFFLDHFYDDHRLDQRSPPNVIANWEHRRLTAHTANGRRTQYPPTNAYYRNVMNPRNGVIISYTIKSPKAIQDAAPQGDPIKVAALPELRQWSDVTFLAWQSLTTEEQRKGLEFLMHYCIFNFDTLATIEVALHELNLQLAEYPGLVLQQSSDPRQQAAFEALLGTPNVQGIAWLLIQHFEALGRQSIHSISVSQHYAAADEPPDGLIANIVVELGPSEPLRRRGQKLRGVPHL